MNSFIKLITSLLLYLFISPYCQAQLISAKELFTRADSLRGLLTSYRTCYDVKYYHLDVKIDLKQRFLSGNNLIKFSAVEDFDILQIDLFNNLSVDKILYKNKKLKFKREYNAVFVYFDKGIKKNQVDSIRIYYSGHPIQATRAPWDGGFVWQVDSNNNPFVATAVQKLGASSWWPNKDHQSDEPDSMLISVEIPKDLKVISNGRLRKIERDKRGKFHKYHWFVSNPINNYCVALNIGDYIGHSDTVRSVNGDILEIEYFLLRENNTKNNNHHILTNIKRTIEALEYWFGPYPFFTDSYKLVETPYLGMEHQSAIAYGNKFLNGYLGRDISQTGWGLKWDFIVVHETGHEWFGNNITSNDLADMWIHEAFTNYSESLFIEYYYGKKAAQEYIFGNRSTISNDKPLQGPYHVNKSGSGDMYNKGGVFLNMIRKIIDNDDRWRDILLGLNKDFKHSQVDYEDIVTYINKKSNRNFDKIFEQYIKFKSLPTLIIMFQTNKIFAKWEADIENFEMPISIGNNNQFETYHITSDFTELEMDGLNRENIKIDTFNYFIHVRYEENVVF